MERGVACIIHDINLCTSIDEQACNLAVAIGNCNMQLTKERERGDGPHVCNIVYFILIPFVQSQLHPKLLNHIHSSTRKKALL